MRTQIDDILTLLALTIIADKKVIDQEVDTFLQIPPQITNDLGLDNSISQSKLLAWIYANQARVKTMLSSPEFDDILIGIFKRTQAVPNKQAILNKMTKIAAADNEIHVSEQALIILAARYWCLPIPNFAA